MNAEEIDSLLARARQNAAHPLATAIDAAGTLAISLWRLHLDAAAEGNADAATLRAAHNDALALWERLCALRDATAAPSSQEAATPPRPAPPRNHTCNPSCAHNIAGPDEEAA